jgi:hypothetical protein
MNKHYSFYRNNIVCLTTLRYQGNVGTLLTLTYLLAEEGEGSQW